MQKLMLIATSVAVFGQLSTAKASYQSLKEYVNTQNESLIGTSQRPAKTYGEWAETSIDHPDVPRWNLDQVFPLLHRVAQNKECLKPHTFQVLPQIDWDEIEKWVDLDKLDQSYYLVTKRLVSTCSSWEQLSTQGLSSCWINGQDCFNLGPARPNEWDGTVIPIIPNDLAQLEQPLPYQPYEERSGLVHAVSTELQRRKVYGQAYGSPVVLAESGLLSIMPRFQPGESVARYHYRLMKDHSKYYSGLVSTDASFSPEKEIFFLPQFILPAKGFSSFYYRRGKLTARLAAGLEHSSQTELKKALKEPDLKASRIPLAFRKLKIWDLPVYEFQKSGTWSIQGHPLIEKVSVAVISEKTAEFEISVHFHRSGRKLVERQLKKGAFFLPVTVVAQFQQLHQSLKTGLTTFKTPDTQFISHAATTAIETQISGGIACLGMNSRERLTKSTRGECGSYWGE